MRTLNFNVNQQIISKEGDFSNIVSESAGYLKCKFSFCSEWEGFLKIAEFRRFENGDCFPVKIENGFCEVPAEVLGGRKWYVSVVGKNGKKKITTNKELIRQEV